MDVCDLSAVDLRAALACRELSAVEALEAVLCRADAVNWSFIAQRKLSTAIVSSVS